MIKLEKINKTYQMGETTHQVLFDVDLEIKANELVSIVGPSGSGKSTLMHIIGLLDKPKSGQYYLDNKNVSDLADDALAELRNKKLGFVFQQFFLLPRLSAIENVILPLSYRGVPLSKAISKAKEILVKIDMGDRMHHRPNELSGGQQQRVAIARALVGEPEIILADEPTGALDTKTGQVIMQLFKKMNEDEKKTVIIITHDQNIAKQCKRVIEIEDGKLKK